MGIRGDDVYIYWVFGYYWSGVGSDRGEGKGEGEGEGMQDGDGE